MQLKTEHASISSIQVSLGPETKRIDDEIDFFGGNVAQIERIKKTIGLDCRRVVDEKTTALDLCVDAAKNLHNLKDIDALIFVTQSPDHFQPCNAAIAHGQLGLATTCAAFDINLGCSGWTYGLSLAFSWIELKASHKILLLAGDTLSRCVNPKDRAVAPLFGDAGSATLIERTEQRNPTWFSMHTKGEKSSVIQIPAGGFRLPPTPGTAIETSDEDGNQRSQNDLFMDGAEVFNFSIKEEPEAIKKMLEYSGKSIDDIATMFLHQANRYILGNIARRIKIDPKRVPSNIVEKYGNQSCASIPTTICDYFTQNPIQKSAPYLMSGFGVGLSWATCLTHFNELDHYQIKTYGRN